MVPAIELRGVTKIHGADEAAVTALDRVDLTVAPATFTAVMGPSGSGKSTLLHVAAGLEEATSGEVVVAGEPLSERDERARTRLRRDRIGVVFQQYNLLPTLTAAQNATLPLRLAGRRVDDARVTGLLDRLGLAGCRDRLPGQLSGGQQQRVAIARALLQEPAVILADEPTGALDSARKAEVLGLLRDAVDDFGQALVMVTHDPIDASHADRVVFLRDGRVDGSLDAPTVEQVTEQMGRLGDLVVAAE